MSALIREITEHTFEDEVFRTDGMVMVCLYRPGDAACDIQRQILQNYARDNRGRVKIVQMDAVKYPQIAFGVPPERLSAVVALKGRKGIYCLTGPAARERLDRFLDQCEYRALEMEGNVFVPARRAPGMKPN